FLQGGTLQLFPSAVRTGNSNVTNTQKIIGLKVFVPNLHFQRRPLNAVNKEARVPGGIVRSFNDLGFADALPTARHLDIRVGTVACGVSGQSDSTETPQTKRYGGHHMRRRDQYEKGHEVKRRHH
ncbi:hypothetical protein HF521_014912, partial [Silurus meridionalis]